MKLVAVVKSKNDKSSNWKTMIEDYETKKEFQEDLKANGYIIRHSYIFTEEQFKSDTFFEELEVKQNKKNIIARCKRGSYK